MTGTLDAVEAVVLAVERAGSIAAAVELVHPAQSDVAIGTVCAMRSIRRRLRSVRAALLAIVTLLPEHFRGVACNIAALREALGTERVLVTMRSLAERHLEMLPAPLGFRNRVSG
jgi:hypothetical protein